MVTSAVTARLTGFIRSSRSLAVVETVIHSQPPAASGGPRSPAGSSRVALTAPDAWPAWASSNRAIRAPGWLTCQATYSRPPVTATSGLLSTRPKTLPGERPAAVVVEAVVVAEAVAAEAAATLACDVPGAAPPQPASSRHSALSAANRMAARARTLAAGAFVTFMTLWTPGGARRLGSVRVAAHLVTARADQEVQVGAGTGLLHVLGVQVGPAPAGVRCGRLPPGPAPVQFLLA